MKKSARDTNTKLLCRLPGDEVRRIMWRFAGCSGLQQLVWSAREVAREIVAPLVTGGARRTYEWTAEKARLLTAFDKAGISALCMEPSQGGPFEGARNLILALVVFELSWVDGGAATCGLAGSLAFSAIHETGTPEQRETYIGQFIPLPSAGKRQFRRGAFCLTEPLPGAGSETSMLTGRVRVAEWAERQEPLLQVEKSGRFTTHMDFADFVLVAVDSGDKRIVGNCMLIIEEQDPGVFNRGAPSRKLVHQLSSTRDPVFAVCVPASRILGGYTVVDGTIVPRYNVGEIIEPIFRHARVMVGVMTAAKLLSAVEPIILYQRNRFRNANTTSTGTPRYELGLQQREDCLHRLVDICATGEAGASLGLAAARLFDELDVLKHRIMASSATRIPPAACRQSEPASSTAETGEVGPGHSQNERSAVPGLDKSQAVPKTRHCSQKEVLEFLELAAKDEGKRDHARYRTLKSDTLVQYTALDSVANVVCPACKLWNTGHGANMMREAVSLLGGNGLTEDCPGFLIHKWLDAQLEATYEGSEAVQRRQLSVTMTNEVFLAQLQLWIQELRGIASTKPGIGAPSLTSAFALWLWTLRYFQQTTDDNGVRLYVLARQGLTFPLADALSWLIPVRFLILDVLELEAKGPADPAVASQLSSLLEFFSSLCHVQSARAAGEAGRICAGLIHGYLSHPAQGEDGNLKQFFQLRLELDSSLSGAMLAKDCAASLLSKVKVTAAER